MLVLSSEVGCGHEGQGAPSISTPAHGAFGRAAVVASLGLCVLGGIAEPAAAYHRHHPDHADPGAGKAAKPEAQRKPEVQKQPSGPLILAVSIGGQRVTVYDNGTPIASSQISTGMAGHATPMGVFSVIQKQRWHHSNLYSNAPMPFMQRITWSGVALHAGVVPGYPASHGCIRLPAGFATRLYGLTKVGARVIVARGDVTPYEINHPRLAGLAKLPDPPKTEGATDMTSGAVVVAATGAVTADDATRNGPEDGAHAPASPQAAPQIAPQVAANPDKAPTEAGKAGEDAGKAGGTATTPPPAPKPEPTPAEKIDQALQRPGHLSLFVSRREGKLFVRKGFTPVFDAPVTIAHPEKALGTHIFTASRPAAEGDRVRWLAVSIGPDRSASGGSTRGKKGRNAERPAPVTGESLRQAASDALDRIEIPKEALDHIAALVGPGSSLLISDQGLGGETGKDTDFIVVTK
jgi:L,D-transpeptidase catalytic domain